MSEHPALNPEPPLDLAAGMQPADPPEADSLPHPCAEAVVGDEAETSLQHIEEATPPAAQQPVPEPAPAPVPTLSPAACATRLAELYPAVFTPGAAKPLKLRIQADIQQRSPGMFTRKVLSLFLQRHTTSTAYLRALAKQAQRVDLDGAPAGEVSEEHRNAAATEVQRRQAVHEERRQAERQAQRAAERQAHEEARRQHAEQDEARRHRAGLLRAFETTTLTRANFCALKQLPEAELDALLTQARQEREQAPRPAPTPARVDPRLAGRGHAPPGLRPDERPRGRPPERGPDRTGERRPRPAGARPPRRGGPGNSGNSGNSGSGGTAGV